MPLSNSQVMSLLTASGSKTGTGQGNQRYCDSDGVIQFGKPSADVVGKFEGKQGTVRRSRKGRTTRLPNGTRKYYPGGDGTLRFHADGTVTKDEVSWYKL
jgi:hypothetical protein